MSKVAAITKSDAMPRAPVLMMKLHDFVQVSADFVQTMQKALAGFKKRAPRL